MSFYHIEMGPVLLDLSIVIPVYNEAPNVEALAGEIDSALRDAPWSWECIWVDDRSTDDTFERLLRLHRTDPRHQYLRLGVRGGQSSALAAGFSTSRGKYIATLDGDGQNDPHDLPPLVEHLVTNDLHAVNGRRQERRDNWVRKVSSRIANGFRNALTGEHVTDVGCSLRVFRRESIDGMLVFKGMHRFLPTLIRMNGYPRIVELPVRHRPRRHGQTTYGISNRIWVGIEDTFAVRWMKGRTVTPRIETSSIEVSSRPGSKAGTPPAGSDRERGPKGAADPPN